MFTRLYRYGQSPNSHDLLKTVAIVLMIIDHIGMYFMPNEHWLRVIGRGAAPFFFFMVGYFPAKKPRWDLVLYGTVLTLSTYFRKDTVFLNILLNFALIKLALIQLEKANLTEVVIRKIVVILMIANPFVLGYIEYGCSGLLFGISAHLQAKRNPHASQYLILACLNHFFYEYIGLAVYTSQMLTFLFLLVLLGVLTVLLMYQEREWQIPRQTRTAVLFLSRYSLEIYFWHLIAFQVVLYLLLYGI